VVVLVDVVIEPVVLVVGLVVVVAVVVGVDDVVVLVGAVVEVVVAVVAVVDDVVVVGRLVVVVVGRMVVLVVVVGGCVFSQRSVILSTSVRACLLAERTAALTSHRPSPSFLVRTAMPVKAPQTELPPDGVTWSRPTGPQSPDARNRFAWNDAGSHPGCRSFTQSLKLKTHLLVEVVWVSVPLSGTLPFGP
jgi:hypothetical protein